MGTSLMPKLQRCHRSHPSTEGSMAVIALIVQHDANHPLSLMWHLAPFHSTLSHLVLSRFEIPRIPNTNIW